MLSKLQFAKIFLLILSVESLPFLSSVAQTTPLIYLLCILVLPSVIKEIEWTPILRTFLLYITYGLIFTLIYFVIEVINGNADIINLRVVNFARQFSGLLLALSLFLTIRKLLIQHGLEFVLRNVIYCIIPISIFVALFDMPWYILRGGDYRIMSYFSEPSHCSEYIVQVIFASIYMYISLPNRVITNKYLALFFTLGFIVLLLTSSGTGFIKLFLLILGIIIVEDNKKLKIGFFFFLLITALGTGYFFYVNSDTYLAKLLVSISEDKDQSGSFVDRFYSFVGPISHLFKSYISLGYGLGGDTIYYKQFYPSEFIETVKLVKDGGFNIVSFWGKILVYTGFVGMIIWLFIIRNAFKAIKNKKPYYKTGAVLLGIFIHGFIGSGAFLLVHTWFWLAVADYAYIGSRN